MSVIHVREKLRNAVHLLATGTESIQRRLAGAMIAMSALEARHFEGERRAKWDSIYSRATAYPTGPYEGRFQNTIFLMSNEDAVRLANDVCELEAMMAMSAD